jgi:hypothetical protein
MPLTQAESGFVAADAFEYMRVEPGPASRKLKERGFVYTDLTYLLEAYEHGNLVEFEGFGRYNPDPSNPPWPDRERAQRRNAEMLAERDRKERLA